MKQDSQAEKNKKKSSLRPYQLWSRNIREKVKQSRIAYGQNLITLSSGAILLTFTAVQLLHNSFYFKSLLKLSWVFFGISIIMGIITQAFILHEDIYWSIGMRNMKEGKTTADLSTNEKEEFSLNFRASIQLSRAGYILEIGQLATFLLAVVFMIIFLFKNF